MILEVAIGIEPMNRAFAKRPGKPRKSLLINKNGTFGDFLFC